MRILIASAHPYIPQIAGGAQSSTHELVLELRARGHNVNVFSGLTGDGWLGLRHRTMLKVKSGTIVSDDVCGYTTYRAWHPVDSTSEVVDAFKPDVVILQSGFPARLAKGFKSRNVPLVFYLRNVEFEDLGGDLKEFSDCQFIANSEFTARKFDDAFGVKSEIIYPLIRPEMYQTETRRESVLFVNPHKHKGLDIALNCARACPEIPFTFQMTWTLSKEDLDELNSALAALPNVRVQARTQDMKQVYAEAKIVLAPSRWEEAFGRISAEAHINGIPVVASAQGGLPESVGPGGVLIDLSEPEETWSSALKRLWTDKAHYDQLVQASLDYAARPALQRDHQLDTLEAVLGRATSLADQ